MSNPNPNSDHNRQAIAFKLLLTSWLDAGASFASVLELLTEECFDRAHRLEQGESLPKGAQADWEQAGDMLTEFNEPEGLI